jgi:hypothetical protein
MNQQSTTTSPVNGASSAHELFALTDEQILEIEPEATDLAPVGQPFLAVQAQTAGATTGKSSDATSTAPLQETTSHPSMQSAQPGVAVLLEPPAWLAAQMKDSWAGAEARELWEGVQRAQAEAAEYRAAISSPEEAKSLRELYPGGVEQARAAAERARALDEFDAAYFGAVGKSTEETSAARTALAQRMMREDPAAFQEMVLAGMRALEAAKKQGSTVAAAQAPRNADTREGNPEVQRHLAAYSEFEKAANRDLEKSVGATIERALQQALPNAGRSDSEGLKFRLATGVRQEIEKALQGDRQLGEQVAQVLSARRFDDTARAQVVRLINERAQQLVPSATKRVLNDWTQTTLAAHRPKTDKQETASQRADLAPAQQGRERATVGSEQRTAGRSAAPAPPRGRIDYKKLSDEQILEL